MDHFGRSDPKLMPRHLFHNALSLDYETAIRADIKRQNYSVCPRHWYLDAQFRCSRCENRFIWSAQEQKVWFEDYRFWIDAIPKQCPTCRTTLRQLAKLRQQYDLLIPQARKPATPEQRRRIVEILLQLQQSHGSLPEKMRQTLAHFQRAIK